jgi:hypothetical protein
MSPLIYVLMCLSGGPGSLDLTADERFWRDEQSCVIVRDKLLKECSCVPFAPGSNASAIVTVPTNNSTPVVPRDKIEDKQDEAKKEKHRHNDEAKNEKNEKHRRHREQQVPVEARYQEDRAIQRYREQQVPVEAQRYQEDRGFGGFSWSNRQY